MFFEEKVKELHKKPQLPTCKYCGEPTSYGRELCKTCELFIKLGLPISKLSIAK